MNALTDADTRRGGKNPPHAGLTSSVSHKAHSDVVSSPNVPIGNGEKPAWFALRVTYGRVEKAAELLRKEKVETFVAQHTISRIINGQKIFFKESLIPNVFFARMTPSHAHFLLEPSAKHLPSYIRFFRNKLLPRQADMMHPPIVISNREMDNFMKLVCVKSEHIKVVDKEKCRFKTGEEVLVIDGAFKGVRGKVARVSSEQRVVIELTSHWLIATAYIPTAFIKKTD